MFDRPGGHDDDNPEDRPFEGRTYLYIRDNVADTGVEPSAPPQWLSPDITVIPPGGMPGDDPQAGVANEVRITVRNGGGLPAIGVWVDAFVADPTTGWTPATAVYVGGVYIDVAPTSTNDAVLSWTPLPGPTHRCMLARCSLIIPNDTYVNPAIFDVANDRHVAQRNLHVVPLPKETQAMSFGFMVVNPLPEARTFFLRVDQVEPAAENLAMLRAQVGCRFAQFDDRPLRDFALTIGDPVDREARGVHFGVLPELAHDVADRQQPTTRVMTEVRLEPGEARRAVLTVVRNPDTRPGDLHVVEVAQYDAETRHPVGGLWLVVEN